MGGGSLYPSQQRPGSQCAHFRFWGSGLRKLFIHFRFGAMNENYAPRDIHGTLPKLAHSKSTIRSAIARRELRLRPCQQTALFLSLYPFLSRILGFFSHLEIRLSHHVTSLPVEPFASLCLCYTLLGVPL